MTRKPCFDEPEGDSRLSLVVAELESQLDACRRELAVTQVTVLVEEGVIKELRGQIEAKEGECEQRVEEETRDLVEALAKAKNDLVESNAVIEGKDQLIAQLQAALFVQASSVVAPNIDDDSSNVTSLRESIKRISENIASASQLLNTLLGAPPSTANQQADSTSNNPQDIQGGSQVQQLAKVMTLVGMEIAELEEATSRADFMQTFCARNGQDL